MLIIRQKVFGTDKVAMSTYCILFGKILRRLRLYINYLYDLFLFKSQTREADLLLIKLDAIGDFVIWQASLAIYKQEFRGKKVILLCSDLVRPLALQDTFFSEVWGYDYYKFLFDIKYHIRFIRCLRSLSFDSIISSVYSRDKYVDRIVRLTIGKQKIGYIGNLSNITLKDRTKGNRYYTRLISNPIPDCKSEILINSYFVQQLFRKEFTLNLPYLNAVTLKGKRWVEGKYCVFCISASFSARAWSVQHFSDLAIDIPEEYQLVLLGHGVQDEQKAYAFLQKVKMSNCIVNLTGKTTLLDYISIISNSAFVIGNDSSAVHIAAAVRVPSICIAPGAHYNRFVPYPQELPGQFYHPRVVSYQMSCFGCDYRCKYPLKDELECIRRVKLSMVLKELNELLVELKKVNYEK